MGPNWAQTICRASWMCNLAETYFSFLFSYYFLFFSAGKWWRSSGQCSQVSPSFTLLFCPSVCVRVCACICQLFLTENVFHGLNWTLRSCACLCVHGHVYTWSLTVCLTQCLQNAPSSLPLLCAKVLQSVETFLQTEAVIGVMRSGWGNS